MTDTRNHWYKIFDPGTLHCGQTIPKIPGKGQISLHGGGGCKTASFTSRRSCWRDVAIVSGAMTLCFETKTTWKSYSLLKIKAWEKNYQSLHSERDKCIPSSCLWFATSTTRQDSSIANHGHEDGIPLSIPECSDRFYQYHSWDRTTCKMRRQENCCPILKGETIQYRK